VGLLSWVNGFELMFGTNGTIDFYGPTSVTTGPDQSVSRYVFTDGGNDAVDAFTNTEYVVDFQYTNSADSQLISTSSGLYTENQQHTLCL
jgi:hypothetical protein